MYTLYNEMKNWIGFLVHVLVHVITNVKTLSSSKFSVNTLLLPVKLKELCRSMYKKLKSSERISLDTLLEKHVKQSGEKSPEREKMIPITDL